MSHQDLVNLHQAITNLNPDARIGASSIDDITWNVGTPIPKSEIEAEIIRVEAEYDAKKYQRDRQPEYPQINEQLDMIYWDKKNGTKKWEEAIDKVKADHPKG